MFNNQRGHTSTLWLVVGHLSQVSGLRTVVPAGHEAHSYGYRTVWGVLAQTQHLPLAHQVLPDGTYLKLGKLQINYLSMVITRVNLLWGEVLPILQKACVIAIRYSVIRRQSCLRPRQDAPTG